MKINEKKLINEIINTESFKSVFIDKLAEKILKETHEYGFGQNVIKKEIRKTLREVVRGVAEEYVKYYIQRVVKNEIEVLTKQEAIQVLAGKDLLKGSDEDEH